jgi:hypothetical protein
LQQALPGAKEGSSTGVGIEPRAQDFVVDLGADDGGAGFGEAHIGFHQLAFERVEFVGGGRGAGEACAGGRFGGAVAHGDFRWIVNAPVSVVLRGGPTHCIM